MFLYFQPIYLQQLGADPLQIGVFIGAVGGSMVLTHIPAGYLSDRLGRRRMMWIAWILGVLATWIMANARSLPWFVGGMLVYGLTGFVTVPLDSYVTASRGRWSVGRAITLISAAFNLGMVFGPLIGGFVGENSGIRQIFFISALVFMVSTVFIFLIQPQPVESPNPIDKHGKFLLNPQYLAYLGAVFLVVFATYLPQPLSQNFLSNERGLTLGTIGILTSMTGLGVAVLNLALGHLNPRLGFLLAQVAVGAFALFIWKGNSLPVYALAYLLLGGYKTTRVLAVAQTRSLTPSSNMGLAYGVTETAAALATILAPLLAGYLYTRNPSWTYSFSILVILVSLAASARFSPAALSAEQASQAPIPEEEYV